jgi:hypothetical protein
MPARSTRTTTADGGASNSHRSRLWKVSLQDLADEGLSLFVCHFPPGTSKWNKIEHRLFSFITQNWRGRPLVSHEAIVNLIARPVVAAGDGRTAPSPVGRRDWGYFRRIRATTYAPACARHRKFHQIGQCQFVQVVFARALTRQFTSHTAR